MKTSARLILLVAISALSVPFAKALPDDEATAGRLILRRYSDVVVTVRGTLVLKMIVGDRPMPPQDNRVEIAGTVIMPSGLTVTSYNALDPQALADGIRSRMVGQGMSFSLGGSELRDLRLVLGDGTEVPAKLVWKDADRDLALLAPTASAAASGRKFTCVDLATAPVAAQILGDYFTIARASEDLKRIPMVRPVTIAGIIERPRRLLLVTTDAPGCPIFDLKGGVLGIALRYPVNGQSVAVVVVPSVDIADAVTQAAAM